MKPIVGRPRVLERKQATMRPMPRPQSELVTLQVTGRMFVEASWLSATRLAPENLVIGCCLHQSPLTKENAPMGKKYKINNAGVAPDGTDLINCEIEDNGDGSF